MNRNTPVQVRRSACPHDCPSTCALEIELVEGAIGRVRGAKDNSYTAGVICEKVARYAERAGHPDRLKQALKRRGEKGANDWQELSVEDALDEVAENFQRVAMRLGSEAVWPYFYAGTMGLVQRDGIHRLRHAMEYSGQFDSICTNMAWSGFMAGTGRLAGPDPREMAVSDLVVIWGTNAVSTQVNVMTHAVRARKTRGARIVAIDVYQTETMRQADLALRLRPGTDGALATAVMHVLFRNNLADRDFLARRTDFPDALERHLETRSPDWAAGITGLSAEQIETFAKWVGETPRTYFRLGYGFTRSRNGAFNMHAASCIASVSGAWQHEGGGAFHSNSGIYRLDQTRLCGLDVRDPTIRMLDQSRVGAVLCSEQADLKGGPPVGAMLIQNTNPANVAPDQKKVLKGLSRNDLFAVVHEQFMTETAALADIVLPATMFTEHDDIYRGGGHQHILLGPKLVDPPGACVSNHDVICGLAQRLGTDHPGFSMSAQDHIEWMLEASGYPSQAEIGPENWIDCQPPFDEAHYINGFAWPDGKFRFTPDWVNLDAPDRPADGLLGPFEDIPALPDYWDVIEAPSEMYPFRLVTAPARGYLNSTFAATPTSVTREGRPTVKINQGDAENAGLAEGDVVRLESVRGECTLHLSISNDVDEGVLVAEGLWPNKAHPGGAGINALTGADPVAPFGGAAFHDNCVRIEKAG